MPKTEGLTVLDKVSCPHCWTQLAPEEALWISEHPDLAGDPKLGDTFPRRFLPSRFTVEGDAVDELGYRTSRLACPNCHLEIPRSMFQIPPVFFSILGAPASGKSYFLASMSWRLRNVLPQEFHVSMNDADTEANARLHEYEEMHFLNPNPEDLVSIRKTEEQGDLYDSVNMGGHNVTLPRPFMFALQPLSKHRHYRVSKKVSRVMCLYDNAGESFLPGADTAAAPVTRHLALSRCLFFLFDPTQDPRFRAACAGKTSDPQMLNRSVRLDREATVRQDTILLEAINRVRRYAGLREDELHQRPLTIIVTKWDCWRDLIPELSNDTPFLSHPDVDGQILDRNAIERASKKVEKLLRQLTPEIVAAAEGFANNLTFLPVSAIGRSPEADETGALGVRPKDVDPYWVDVPILHALSRWAPGLVGMSNSEAKDEARKS